MFFDSVSQLFAVRILDMSKKKGFHHPLVVQPSFLAPSTEDLPLRFFFSSFSYGLGTVFFWQPATVGLQDRRLDFS
jgi:hypothetical protein